MQAAHVSNVPEPSVVGGVEPRRTSPRDLALMTIMAGVAGIGAGILIAAGAGASLPWVDRLAVASGVAGAVGLCAALGQTRTGRHGTELSAALEERERAIASLLSATRGTSESAARLPVGQVVLFNSGSCSTRRSTAWSSSTTSGGSCGRTTRSAR